MSPDEEIVGLNIPTGMPLVYELDDGLRPLKQLLSRRSGEGEGRHGSRRRAGQRRKADCGWRLADRRWQRSPAAAIPPCCSTCVPRSLPTGHNPFPKSIDPCYDSNRCSVRSTACVWRSWCWERCSAVSVSSAPRPHRRRPRGTVVACIRIRGAATCRRVRRPPGSAAPFRLLCRGFCPMRLSARRG